MENNKKQGIFYIKASPKKQKEIFKELSKVNDLKKAIHFVKNNKKYIKVNRKFKAKAVKFSIATVASLTSIVMAMSIIKANKRDNIDIKPLIPTTVEVTEPDLNPVVQEESIVAEPTITISFPKASDTNELSDRKNYEKAKEKYGAYIEKVAKESGIDARIFYAVIGQENVNNIDMSKRGSYGPTCITNIQNGETYTYYHYNSNNEYVCDKVTIDINKIKPSNENNQIYENGKYGPISVAEANALDYTAVILKGNYSIIDKANDSLNPAEKLLLAVCAYNNGVYKVKREAVNNLTLSEITYSLENNQKSKFIDKQYGKHVFNKIDDLSNISFVDNNGNTIVFNMEKNNEEVSFSSRAINNKTL